jgi:hypothetical protein
MDKRLLALGGVGVRSLTTLASRHLGISMLECPKAQIMQYSSYSRLGYFTFGELRIRHIIAMVLQIPLHNITTISL